MRSKQDCLDFRIISSNHVVSIYQIRQERICYKCNDILQPINSLRPSDMICVNKTTRIGADNGLSPGRRQAIIWTNAGLMLDRPVGTKFSGILIEILTFSFKKMHSKMWSVKWRPFCVGLNVLNPGPVDVWDTNLQISKLLCGKVNQWPNSLTWVNFNPSMDK